MELKPGETVLDYCAGNGGKTFAIASRILEPKGIEAENNIKSTRSRIVAHDISVDRLKRLSGSLGRVGILPEDISTTMGSDPLFSLSDGGADVVLVDAPCSSSGTLRRSPSHRFELTSSIVKDFPKLQLDILNQAAKLTKVGGRLVYSTCSILELENEGVVDAFESSSISGKWKRWSFQEREKDDPRPHCRVLLPSLHNDSDGFFIARWIKTE